MRTLVFYSPHNRGEQLIAAGRLVLSLFFLLAVYLDPSEPAHFATSTFAVLAGYAAYSFVLAIAVWRCDYVRNRQRFLSHAVDLLVFTGIICLTEGPASPFFAGLVFLLACATMRWQLRGTILTAAISLAVLTVLALFPAKVLTSQDFALNQFVIRIAYLVVVAILLGYLGEHEQSLRTMFARLAVWPNAVSDDLQAVAGELLTYAADTLRAPRLILLWEDEEPWINTAVWSQREFRYSREHPAAFGAIVTPGVTGMNFLCQDASRKRACLIHDPETGMRTWYGTPLDSCLLGRFAIGPVLGTRLGSAHLSGYLLMLDKPLMSHDDMLLCEIVAHEVESRLDHYYLLKQLQQTAVAGERVRLARDLHDGILQSLTGAVLQLETVQRLVATDPDSAGQRVRELQALLAREQADLRTQIKELRPFIESGAAEDFALAGRLDELGERIRRQWDLDVEITVQSRIPEISRGMSREIYFVIHEALMNAVRHSGARTLQAQLRFAGKWARIVVCDNGSGFAFRGRYDLEQLTEMKRGPVTLRERIFALQGTLTVESQATGASLEIGLPLTELGG